MPGERHAHELLPRRQKLLYRMRYLREDVVVLGVLQSLLQNLVRPRPLLALDPPTAVHLQVLEEPRQDAPEARNVVHDHPPLSHRSDPSLGDELWSGKQKIHLHLPLQVDQPHVLLQRRLLELQGILAELERHQDRAVGQGGRVALDSVPDQALEELLAIVLALLHFRQRLVKDVGVNLQDPLDLPDVIDPVRRIVWNRGDQGHVKNVHEVVVLQRAQQFQGRAGRRRI
mmetsp:Transcript_2323/g.6440  ORF Transcript_2323/g.6440 Transcript_2323/m.6440 type:complete len:229 (-) Transcript_2323:1631-2317(-)